MGAPETVKKGLCPFLTKGLQSAARTSCPLTADKTHTCSLSCIFCQVQEVNCPEGARETTLGCAPTENDQNPFAACGRQTLRGFFDTLRGTQWVPLPHFQNSGAVCKNSACMPKLHLKLSVTFFFLSVITDKAASLLLRFSCFYFSGNCLCCSLAAQAKVFVNGAVIIGKTRMSR